MTTATDAPLLSVAQVAARLNVSRASVYRLVEGGGLPAIRLGGAGRSLRVAPAELEQWLRDRHTPRKEPDDE